MMMKCKLPALCMALVMLWAFCAQAEEVNPDQPVQLTVSMQWQGHSVVGVPIKLYRIAEKDASGQWQLIAPFDRYNVDIHVESESDMARIASTLEGYILRDNLPPDASALTDAVGEAVFPTQGSLPHGLYLVRGERHLYDGWVYAIQPSVVMLPYWDQVNQQWINDVSINAKFECMPDLPYPNLIDLKVLKIWEDNGENVALPEKITVHLLCDGEIYDTVELTAENLWRYRWTGLAPGHHWTVVEDEMEGWQVSITREGITFVTYNAIKGRILFPKSGITKPLVFPEPYLRTILNRKGTQAKEKLLRCHKSSPKMRIPRFPKNLR